MLRIGVDTGGTFTDFVVQRADGALESFKLPSNPKDPAAVILAGIERATGGVAAEVIHGSTVATNALLERKGACTAFVTTAGFEDLLEIGRQNRAALYELSPPPMRMLVPAELCFGVDERTYHDGTIARRPRNLKRLAAGLRKANVESVAICFLHGWQTPDNERAVKKALEGLGYVCASHEVAPEFREYERASTTVLNAYVGPLMDRYLGNLERQVPHRLEIMQSNGGLLPATVARRQAVRTILSGPAGGVVGAAGVARASGFSKILGFDMGGTSTDVSLCEGEPRETTEASVDGVPIRVPMLDIHTVGAGGGSLARIDDGGLLRVGPESAGAAPGPACYGTGTEPTVTDAHVVLGRIAFDQLAGGEMRVDPERARAAIGQIASRLRVPVDEAAAGILRVANSNMERAIRAVSVERGYDPREFVLLAFGGGGGLHACEIATHLDIRTVVVPQLAGALSAFGMLVADRVRDYAAGVLGGGGHAKVYKELAARARAELPRATLRRFADRRYAGQSYELTIGEHDDFHAAHEKAYGFAMRDREIETVSLRVRATLAVKNPAPRHPGRVKPRRRVRSVHIDGSWREVRALLRNEAPGRATPGPALILDYGSTTLVPAGWRYRCDDAGNLICEHVRS
ncbi:MAG: hydantoinase/oxoprolinase family protein [Acidobacteria bacterium]|nr:hydantoinase/oxoprolinase family protein [Acidobacteriota bacterium]